MYRRFADITNSVGSLAKSRIVVASADLESMEAIKLAITRGLAGAVLVGNVDDIVPAAERLGIMDKVEVIPASTPVEAAQKAVTAIHEGRGNALLKGFVNTSDFLHVILDREKGLRTGHLLSHLAIMEIPGEGRLSFCTDSGFNVAPDLEKKKQILHNALGAAYALGYDHINVACLAANEKVNPHIPSTVDAAELVKAWKSGEFDADSCGCTVEGPMAIDVVASRASAEHKKIKSEIAGNVDLTLAPNIECGNVCCKTLEYYCHAMIAGFVIGAKVPVMLVSRSDPPENKYNSIAFACTVANGRK